MSFSWFRVEADLVDHPKVFALEARLKDPNALAYVIRLFAWTHRYAKDGRVSNTLRDQLEAALRWPGERGKLLQALLSVGLLDATRRTLDVHDWPEYQGKLVEKSSRDAENKRKRRAAAKAAAEEAARAGRADGARTYPTDGRTRQDGRSLDDPSADFGTGETQAPPRRGEKNWGAVAERLVTWIRAQRSLAGKHPAERETDVAAIDAWALAWALKHEPDERAFDQMCAAFNAYLADPWAIERGCALALWCSENVGLHRWTEQRAGPPKLRAVAGEASQ